MQKKRNILEGKLQPPVGVSDWASFSQDRYCVDKTLLIKDIVDRKTSVALFTRPRRFGKTSAMEMLKSFFEKTDEDTSKLFIDKKIWAAGEEYRAKQGKYPVIYLTFKDHTGENWEEAFDLLISDVAAEVERHRDAVCSDWNVGEFRNKLIRVMECSPSLNELKNALKYLSMALHSYHGVKPIILVDEYDTPVTTASTKSYYDKMVGFMRSFFSGAMKDNKHCEMGVITGVLRVAKEGILSGLNNLSVWTVFSTPFSQYFGFTEEEVFEMADYYGVPEKMSEIKKYYDGYNFGGTEIYNPWSVLNYFANECKPGIYWVNTSDNGPIKDLIKTYPHDFADTAEQLLKLGVDDTKFRKRKAGTKKAGRGKKEKGVIVPMVEELGSYREVTDTPESLYCLLVSAGYLKVVDQPSADISAVRIPNKELAHVFVREIKSKIGKTYVGKYRDIEYAIINNDMPALQKNITQFLRESVSYFDGAAEGFFHGLTLGLLATLRDCYRIESNTESGDGRLDISLTPRSAKYPGFVIEVKAADSETDNLDAIAKDALEQITTKEYTAKMLAEYEARGYTQPLVKIGLAYYKKRVSLIQN